MRAEGGVYEGGRDAALRRLEDVAERPTRFPGLIIASVGIALRLRRGVAAALVAESTLASQRDGVRLERGAYGIFQKAPQRKNVIAALAAARELPQLSLADALELTLLVAWKDPRRHSRVAARWLQRYLEEDSGATIEEAGLAASALLALTGAGYQEAVQTLRAMAERATRRRRERGLA